MEKVKKFLSNAKFKAECLATSCALGIASSDIPVLADGESTGGGSPQTVVLAAVDAVVKMFPFIGAFFIVAGVFKLILAYRNDQPEAQAGAAKDIVIGAVFLVFKGFIWSGIQNNISFPT